MNSQIERSQESVKTDVARLESRVNSTSETVKTLESQVEAQTVRIKEVNEYVYDVKNVQLVALNTRVSQQASDVAATRHDVDKLKSEIDQKVERYQR